MKYDETIFKKMIELKLLPGTGIFSITEEMKKEYVKIYASLQGNGNVKTKSNKAYALRLAGLSLLKLNKVREEKTLVKEKTTEKTKSGIVYIISNVAFPNYYKIGITQNLEERLASYQTYDPLRRYKVEHYKVVENARQMENYFLSHHKINIRNSEWVHGEEIKSIFLE
jgi:hypothetical protein